MSIKVYLPYLDYLENMKDENMSHIVKNTIVNYFNKFIIKILCKIGKFKRNYVIYSIHAVINPIRTPNPLFIRSPHVYPTRHVNPVVH